MPKTARSSQTVHSAVCVENETALGQVLLVCEHASCDMPNHPDALGLPEAARKAHIAWDPGALGVAQGLSKRLDATLFSGTQSRLIYDLNRPPHSKTAIPEHSEAFSIPGNAKLSQNERLSRTEELYLPFHEALHTEIVRRLAQGRTPTLVTIHSFTPVYNGKAREIELGIIHDSDPALAMAVSAEASKQLSLATALNQPYDANDGVTHMLRLHATPYGLRNVMLEIRNDLIATPEDQDKMAECLTPILKAALVVAEASVTGVA